MNDILYVPTKKYVYFDDKGNILSVSNTNKAEGNYVETDIEDVRNLITGKEQFFHYHVTFDTAKKTYILKHVYDEDDYHYDVNDRIHCLSRTQNDKADLTVQQDTKNKSWKFILDDEIKTNIKIKKIYYNKPLLFSITRKNDPNQLERIITLNIRDLVDKDVHEIPFEFEIELDSNALSVYTTKRLESYYHEVI